MESRIELQIPEQIDEETDFTYIFGGALLEHLKEAEREDLQPVFFHAGLFPNAVKFFLERTKKGVNPTSILEKALRGTGPFIPGCSVISSVIYDLMRLYYHDGVDEALEVKGYGTGSITNPRERIEAAKKHSGKSLEELFRLKHSDDFLSKLLVDNYFRIVYPGIDNTRHFEDDPKTGKSVLRSSLEFGLSAGDYERAFAQVLTGGIEASAELGYSGLLRVPSFADRNPNYFDEVPLSHVGEGLQRGTLFVEGNVADCLGKHSTGGTIVVTGTAGEGVGDCSRNVNYYIGGNATKVEIPNSSLRSITQAYGCNFTVLGNIMGEIYADKSNINIAGFFMPDLKMDRFSVSVSRGEKEKYIEKLKERGCGLHEWDSHATGHYGERVSSILGSAA